MGAGEWGKPEQAHKCWITYVHMSVSLQQDFVYIPILNLHEPKQMHYLNDVHNLQLVRVAWKDNWNVVPELCIKGITAIQDKFKEHNYWVASSDNGFINFEASFI